MSTRAGEAVQARPLHVKGIRPAGTVWPLKRYTIRLTGRGGADELAMAELVASLPDR